MMQRETLLMRRAVLDTHLPIGRNTINNVQNPFEFVLGADGIILTPALIKENQDRLNGTLVPHFEHHRIAEKHYINRRSYYYCSLCKQPKRGHRCSFTKNKNDT